MPSLVKMASDNFTSTLALQYTPPGAPVNTGVASLTVAGTYQAGQAGSIDVPPGTIVGTVLPIPFGSVAAAKLLIVRNNMSSEIGIRINGAVANNFNIPPGGEFAYLVSSAPLAVPLTSVSLVTTVDPSATERLLYWTFGD